MTPPKRKALISWSSGKDSAWTLHVLRQRGDLDVVGLLTTINEVHARVAMHAVRLELLRLQAAAAGLPVWEIPIRSPCTNEQYEAKMGEALSRARYVGVEVIAFGDLFLEDIRRYREERMRGTGIEPIFPIWGIPTGELARTMIAGGLQARITCVDPKQISAKLAGRAFDEALLAELPPTADPCGERGEFHTFAHAGPMFERPIAVTIGEVVEKDGFVFADVLSQGSSAQRPQNR
jgi:uncharacterized protein (TIGR00290 family)